jgi:hypothetical protein
MGKQEIIADLSNHLHVPQNSIEELFQHEVLPFLTSKGDEASVSDFSVDELTIIYAAIGLYDKTHSWEGVAQVISRGERELKTPFHELQLHLSEIKKLFSSADKETLRQLKTIVCEASYLEGKEKELFLLAWDGKTNTQCQYLLNISWDEFELCVQRTLEKIEYMRKYFGPLRSIDEPLH